MPMGALAGSKVMSFWVPAAPGVATAAGTWIVTSMETVCPAVPLPEPTTIAGAGVPPIRVTDPLTPVAPAIWHWLPQPLLAGLLITTLLMVKGNGPPVALAEILTLQLYSFDPSGIGLFACAAVWLKTSERIPVHAAPLQFGG